MEDIDIIKLLESKWPAHYALQPKNADERRCVKEIQALKKLAFWEILELRYRIVELENTTKF